MIELIATLLVALGLFFLMVGSIGVFRLPGLYLRLQAATKSLTFGFGFLILGAGMLTGDPATFGKAFVAVIFQFLTSPIAAHMIGRSALRNKIAPAAVTEEFIGKDKNSSDRTVEDCFTFSENPQKFTLRDLTDKSNPLHPSHEKIPRLKG